MATNKLTEKELLQELKQIEAAKKNPERFGVLYNKYYKQIFLFIYKRTDSEEVCGDVCSQVFLKAMLNLKKYSYRGVPFSAWLYRIASNEINQYYRSKKGERVVSMDQNDIERVFGLVDEMPEDNNNELFRQVMLEALEEMKEDEVQIIELRFFEKRPFSEVGYIMGITENNAKVRVYRILERLKKRMKKKLEGAI